MLCVCRLCGLEEVLSKAQNASSRPQSRRLHLNCTVRGHNGRQHESSHAHESTQPLVFERGSSCAWQTTIYDLHSSDKSEQPQQTLSPRNTTPPIRAECEGPPTTTTSTATTTKTTIVEPIINSNSTNNNYPKPHFE